MNRSPKAFLSATILAAGLIAVPAMAQTAPPAQSGVPAATMQPTDAQLQKFVQASQKVAVVAQEYQPKLHATPDEDTRKQVMQEAEEKMIQLVSADGLTVDEFNGISMAVEQDPQLRQRVIDMVNE